MAHDDNLIAAAPAMLEALCALVDPDEFDRHPQDFTPEWHRARAAISLAQFGYHEAVEVPAAKPMAPIVDHEIQLVIALARVIEPRVRLAAVPAIVVDLLEVIRHYGSEDPGKDQAG